MVRDHITARGSPGIDMPLLLAVMAIITLGLVNLYSATSVYADDAQRAQLADIYVSQIYWIVVGTLLAILVASIDYRSFDRLAFVSYFAGLVALGLVFVLARSIRGASRWIAIGSFNFQPSEFMKIVLILVVARHLHNDSKVEPRTLVDLARPALLTLVPVAFVMAQPDLGTSLIYLLTAGSMIAMTRIRTRSLVTLGVMLATALPLAWNFLLLRYQRDRITRFLNPENDSTGAGWHAFQAQTAIGNGQLFGEGFMQGTQNQFRLLPDQFSDFPFAVLRRLGLRRRSRAARPVLLRGDLGHPRRVAGQGPLRRSARDRRRRQPLLARRPERRHGRRRPPRRRRDAPALQLRRLQRRHDDGRPRPADECVHAQVETFAGSAQSGARVRASGASPSVWSRFIALKSRSTRPAQKPAPQSNLNKSSKSSRVNNFSPL